MRITPLTCKTSCVSVSVFLFVLLAHLQPVYEHCRCLAILQLLTYGLPYVLTLQLLICMSMINVHLDTVALDLLHQFFSIMTAVQSQTTFHSRAFLVCCQDHLCLRQPTPCNAVCMHVS